MSGLEEFRSELRGWLEENCPASMRAPMVEEEMPGGGLRAVYKKWLEASEVGNKHTHVLYMNLNKPKN